MILAAPARNVRSAFILAVTIAIGAGSASAQTNPVAAYAFNEGSGTTVADASGNGNAGTIGTATWTTAGKFGGALSFNGSNARVTIPDAPALRLTTAMTLEAWVNPSAVSGAWRDVIYKGNDNYYLEATTTSSSRPAIGGTFNSTHKEVFGTATLPLNTWTHLAATYDGATLRLYVNGAQVGSAARTGSLATSTNPLQVGGDNIFGQYFQGLIDEVRVYNVALTAAQIQTDMNAAVGGGTSVPDLTLTKTHTGNFTQGQTGTYTITVRNAGSGSTSGVVTATDTLPGGMTATAMSGTGWSCTLSSLTCTRSDALAAGATYPALTLTVNVASTAPASVTNTARVSGGGQTNTANDAASDVTTVTQLPDLTLTKTHTGNFTPGQTGATYTIAVRNSGTGASSGTVTVTDTVPAGLTATALSGSGWTCTLSTRTCTRGDALAAGANYPSITLTVNVSSSAPSSVTNTASVSGGGDTNNTNNTANDVTAIAQAQAPDLTLTKTHAGTFTQGQTNASYALTVANGGNAATSGTVTVVDTLPGGLTATAMSGNGWSCAVSTLTCTRSDVLPAGTSYSPITLTVDVSSSAPSSVTNTATVSGGGDGNGANNTASDPTSIAPGSTEDTLAPGAPGTLNASTAADQVTLTWSPATDNVGVVSYRVEQCLGTGCSTFTEIGTVNAANMAPMAAPLTASANPNYFKDANGTAVVLNGSQTWNTLQDWGTNGTIQPLDFNAFVNFLVSHGHNFTLLWRTELARFCGLPTSASSPPDFTVGPHPWLRTGPGTATDGGPKFDLTRFDQSYFDRLRTRVQALRAAGIYTGVYLFSGEWVNAFRCGADGYAFSVANNVNGIDDGGGTGSMTMNAPNAVTALQDAYVEKLVDTLNDLSNVLWIVSEEAPVNSTWWNAHQISHLRAYEGAKAFQHPIGYATLADLQDPPPTNSDADWIAPGSRISPTSTCGSGTPRCKVNVNDSDHSYFGMWNDSAQGNRNYAWENFATGNQVLFMDPYVVYYPRENRNLCPTPINGVCAAPDSRWDNFRDNLGYIGRYARKLDLNRVTPRSNLCSTGYCLAQTPSSGAEYLVYAPNGGSFSVDVSAMPSSRTLNVEWLNPSTGATTTGTAVAAGSSSRTFTPPFSGDAVLYLVDSAGHQTTAPTTITYTVTGLPAGTYGYRVRAADAAGNLGPYSNVATAAVQGAPSPDLTLTKTHTGNFTAGQTGAAYTVTVRNSGTGATSGTVTMSDTLPSGLSATALSGSGWSCSVATVSCSRSDVLAAGANYPAITVTVNVAANAPSSVTNTAAASGGGQSNTSNDTASDVTTVVQVSDLTLTKSHTGNFLQGQTGATYAMTARNSGAGPTSGGVSVVDTLPSGLTATAMTGAGWSCTLATLTCTRADVLAAGASYPAITLTVNVAGNAPTSVTNTATVSGGGQSNTANDSASDPTTVSRNSTGVFQNEILISGMDLPTALQFLPDGSMLILELGGKIWQAPAGTTQVRPTPFLSLTNIGTANGQQGLMGMVLDPDFATNHYYYVFYTLGSPNRDRVSRFTATADLTGTIAGTEMVIYQDPLDASTEHHGGALSFGNDGKLYITTGEHFDGSNSPNLSSPRGKILRVNKDGTIPTDNPFYDGAGPNRDDVWARGLRNPFRTFYDAPTDRLFIADVGGNDYSVAKEEVNIGVAGANYGWPNCEGTSCAGNPAYTSPIFSYPHNGRDASITGGFVYRGSQFPAAYYGSYFYADYAQNWIRRLTFDATGAVNGDFSFEPPDGSADGPYGDIVYLTEGPDGALYYVDLGFSDTTGQTGISRIRRIKFIANDQPPTATAAASPSNGPAPLNVTFSSAGSADPEGQPLTYLWTFGDGTTSTAANPSHVYTQNGSYSVTLAVSDGTVQTLSTPLRINVGHSPVPSIQNPADGTLFRAGDSIQVSGDATDEDEVLPDSAFSWTVDFLHAGHVHPGLPTSGTRSFVFTIPTSGHDFSGDTRYRITLTVTDADGLQSSQAVVIYPDKVNLSFASNPSGLTVTLDGNPHTTPFVYDTLIGFTHTVDAPDQTVAQTAYTFGSWSDGGARQHAITVPAGAAAYTANYSVASAPYPAGLVGGYRLNEGTGTTAADISGNNITGTLVNSPTWTTGKYSGALNFTGTNYVNLGNPTALKLTGSMTLSSWIYITANPSDDASIVGKLGPAGWQLKTSPDTGVRTAAVQISSNGSNSIQRYSSTVLALNTWYHIAGVYDAAARTLNIYVNGQLNNGVLSGTVPAAQVDAPYAVNIAQRTGSPGTFNFRGRIDEVHIFNRALSASEIQDDMTRPR